MNAKQRRKRARAPKAANQAMTVTLHMPSEVFGAATMSQAIESVRSGLNAYPSPESVRYTTALFVLALFIVRCAAPQSASRPVCGPCIAPSSGPVYLDEVQVRQLLKGVEREEGVIRAERDEALTGKSNAEAYADQVKRDAVIYGTMAAGVAAAIAAGVTAAVMAAHAQPAVSK